jgi:hypothetical protein
VSRDLERLLKGLFGGSWIEWAAFVTAVVVIAGAAWAVSRYRASLHGDADPAAAETNLVRHVREMRDRGEVSESEYRSLKSRIAPPGGGAPRQTDAPRPETPPPEAGSAGR